MSIGRYVSDLDTGDMLGPVEYDLGAFAVREYCHAIELDDELFQGAEDAVVPPTLVHIAKLRLYQAACPQGTGPDARIHVEFDATFKRPIPVGTRVKVSGTVAERYEKRGRDFVVTDIEMRDACTDVLLVDYRDTVVLAYRPSGDRPAA